MALKVLWSMEDNLDSLQWKTTFSGRWPLVEYDLWWKTTFSGRRPSVEDDLWWKMTLGVRQPSVEDDLWGWFLPLTITAKLSPNQNFFRCPPYATVLWFLFWVWCAIRIILVIGFHRSNSVLFADVCLGIFRSSFGLNIHLCAGHLPRVPEGGRHGAAAPLPWSSDGHGHCRYRLPCQVVAM